MFELITDLASHQPPKPQNVAVLRALIGNQAQTNRFFGVLTGSVPVGESSHRATWSACSVRSVSRA